MTDLVIGADTQLEVVRWESESDLCCIRIRSGGEVIASITGDEDRFYDLMDALGDATVKRWPRWPLIARNVAQRILDARQKASTNPETETSKMSTAIRFPVSTSPCTWVANEITDQVDETGEPIRPGWYITAVGDDPEDVYAEIFIDFAVDLEGHDAARETTRRLVDLLNRDEQQTRAFAPQETRAGSWRHSTNEGCFFCATDKELAEGVAGRPVQRNIYFDLRPDQCPHDDGSHGPAGAR
jgi:hypothetical protein